MLRKEELTAVYHPITAEPYGRRRYTELQPCAALAPYVRCFWGTDADGSEEHTADTSTLVIPDTCMDIIFHFNAENRMTGSGFSVMDDRPYRVGSADAPAGCSTFAIRFYGWSAVLFARDRFTGCRNGAFAVAAFFPELQKELVPLLESVTSLEKRAQIAGRYLLKLLDRSRMNYDFMNAVYDIIDSRGTLKVSGIAAGNGLSNRHLERIFTENMGISPKNFSSLVRYQMLWQDFCRERKSDVLDLVDKYAYYDQAHLLNDFRKYHGMTPKQAIELARG